MCLIAYLFDFDKEFKSWDPISRMGVSFQMSKAYSSIYTFRESFVDHQWAQDGVREQITKL